MHETFPLNYKEAEGLTRHGALRALELYYLRVLVEDPQDGTNFDCDVLDAISTLKRKYE